MKPTDKVLNELIQQSQYGKPELREDFWFSFQNQNRLAFGLAQQLYIDGMNADDAIISAKEFIDSFYKQVVRPGSWER